VRQVFDVDARQRGGEGVLGRSQRGHHHFVEQQGSCDGYAVDLVDRPGGTQDIVGRDAALLAGEAGPLRVGIFQSVGARLLLERRRRETSLRRRRRSMIARATSPIARAARPPRDAAMNDVARTVATAFRKV